jgi:uncharacterized protein (TIGR02757 family)
MMRQSPPSLRPFLNRVYRKYHRRAYLYSDPLEFSHQYADKADQEIVAFLSACLAYGSVQVIRKTLLQIFGTMNGHPYEFVYNFSPPRHSQLFDGLRHRFNTGHDIACLIFLLHQVLRESGSIKQFFLTCYQPNDATILPSLERFANNLWQLDASPYFPGVRGVPKRAAVRFLFPSPANGSACKRPLLFLRWVVRPQDQVDLGLWPEIPPDRLIVPLDTHLTRISKRLGLTTRNDASMKTALEVTQALKRFDHKDPVKYDFALCRLGILKFCPARRNTPVCQRCALYAVCAENDRKKHNLK